MVFLIDLLNFPMASDFPCDVFSVFFDGKLGEVEFFGNFLGGVTLLDLGNNFELTEGKIYYSDMRWHAGIELGLGTD